LKRSSLEFTQNLIDDKLGDVSKDVENKIRNIEEKSVEYNKKQITKTDRQHNELLEKLRILEDRNRRNNLRIDGIKENDNESWEETEKKIRTREHTEWENQENERLQTTDQGRLSLNY